MNDSSGSQGDNLEETARKQNLILQGFIDAIGTLIATSRELLKRSQPAGRVEPADPERSEPRESEKSPDTDHRGT